jgi:dTDP-4-dehydrorhamnose reductase
MANILITGGSGRLGKALLAAAKDYPEHIFSAPSHSELDITESPLDMAGIIQWADTVIHCAAFANTFRGEIDRRECWNVNVGGTLNIVRCHPFRLIYVSTDYVFDGSRGNYREDDIPDPVNFYGLAKLMGEAIARTVLNHLVLRAPFRDDPPWKYKRAFSDQWTSADFVSVRAPQILRAALTDLTGILHIGGPRRSTLELARMASPEVGEMSIAGVGCPLPSDCSLDCSKWESLKKACAL